MRPQEEIVQKLLIDSGLVGDPESPDTPEWPLFVDAMPEDPDNCLVVDGQAGTIEGRFMVNGEVQGMQGVRIALRSNDPKVGYQLLWDVQQYLDETVYLTEVEIEPEEGTDTEVYTVHSMTRQGQILRLGQGQTSASCWLFSVNYLVSFTQES